MSAEELRRERVETTEELRRTQDAFGSSSWASRAVGGGGGWRLDYGGWISPAFTSSADNDRDRAAQDALDHTWDMDLRLYTKLLSRSGKSQLYARFKTTHASNSRASEAVRKSDWIQPAVDMLYYSASIQAGSVKNTLTAGRQFILVERGVSFGLTVDGLGYEMQSRRNRLQIFFARQLPGDDNVDYLAKSPGRSKRFFYGGEWIWKYIRGQQVGLMTVFNSDQNDGSADAAGQKHQIDSQYYGIGFEGNIFARLSYWVHHVRETGKTHSDFATTLSADKIGIDAAATNLGLRYFFPTRISPSVYFEYASGSGDADAKGNTSSTTGGSGSLAGSGAGGKDRRFISFGGLSLGYALAPQLANLSAYKLGMSLKPFGYVSSAFWNNMTIQPAYYEFRRKSSTGATSDPYTVRAAGQSNDIGSELDFTWSWVLWGDLQYQFKYGKFMPGHAYDSRGTETYLRLKISVDL